MYVFEEQQKIVQLKTKLRVMALPQQIIYFLKTSKFYSLQTFSLSSQVLGAKHLFILLHL